MLSSPQIPATTSILLTIVVCLLSQFSQGGREAGRAGGRQGLVGARSPVAAGYGDGACRLAEGGYGSGGAVSLAVSGGDHGQGWGFGAWSWGEVAYNTALREKRKGALITLVAGQWLQQRWGFRREDTQKEQQLKKCFRLEEQEREREREKHDNGCNRDGFERRRHIEGTNS